MSQGRPTISTHVLDTGSGAPAPGIRVRLWRVAAGSDGGTSMAGEAETDTDGRVADLLGGTPLEAGGYRLEFLLGDGFFGGVSVGLRVDDPTRSYHVPLLRAPFGLTLYRGS